MRPVVELVNASKTYRAHGEVVCALREANLSLAEGSLTAVVGRSGCGKTTLLSLPGAGDLPTSGEVRANREPLPRLRGIREADGLRVW